MASQGTTLATTSYPELTDLIKKKFVQLQEMEKPLALSLYNRDEIGEGQGDTKRYDEVDTGTFASRKYEGQGTRKASFGVGYSKTVRAKRIGTEVDITWEMRKFNRYQEVGSLITNLGHYCPQRMELDATHLLTFASATSYTDMDGDTVDLTVGDGLALCATAHTLKYSSTTYSNRVAGDPIFSAGALEAAELLFANSILSNFGQRRVISPDTIVTSNDPNTIRAVRVLLGSEADVDQDNAGVMNAFRSKYRHVALPYLATTATGAYDSTKRRYWFLGAFAKGGMGWQSYMAIWESPRFKEAPGSNVEGKSNDDYSRDVWSYGTRATYAPVAVSGKGIVGSLVTS